MCFPIAISTQREGQTEAEALALLVRCCWGEGIGGIFAGEGLELVTAIESMGRKQERMEREEEDLKRDE